MTIGTRNATATETERVYEVLKREILTDVLPAGSMLRQAEIARRLSTSRTPVREAEVRLADEWLVDLSPGRGARVAQLSVQDYLEVNQLRFLLEPVAARNAATNLSDEAIRSMELALEGLGGGDVVDLQRLAELDRIVHASLARHCGNARMHRYLDQLNGMMSLARAIDLASQGRDMVESLRTIINAAARRDGDAAEAAMRAHVAEFTRRLPALLPASQTPKEE